MPPLVTVSGWVFTSPGIIGLIAAKAVGLTLMSIVPAVKFHVAPAVSVNWASEIEPAPMVSIEIAPSRATIPRRRRRRRSTRFSVS